MDREELIGLGDASIRKALANMFAILNKNGEILTKIGGADNADKMMFSPRLECGKDCSVMLFDDEDKARGAIEEILVPQDDDEYHVFKFTALDDGDDVNGDNYENAFDIECDSDGGEDDCAGDGQDAEKSSMTFDIDFDDKEKCNDDEDGTFDSGGMSLDDAIEHAREVGTNMLSENPDCDCGKEHLQLAKWLEELRSLRGANGQNDESDEHEDIEESVASSIKNIRRILKRNGYQLVSQKGFTQKWKKDASEEPIELPCAEDIFDGTKWSEIVKSRGLTTDFED